MPYSRTTTPVGTPGGPEAGGARAGPRGDLDRPALEAAGLEDGAAGGEAERRPGRSSASSHWARASEVASTSAGCLRAAAPRPRSAPGTALDAARPKAVTLSGAGPPKRARTWSIMKERLESGAARATAPARASAPVPRRRTGRQKRGKEASMSAGRGRERGGGGRCAPPRRRWCRCCGRPPRSGAAARRRRLKAAAGTGGTCRQSATPSGVAPRPSQSRR